MFLIISFFCGLLFVLLHIENEKHFLVSLFAFFCVGKKWHNIFALAIRAKTKQGLKRRFSSLLVICCRNKRNVVYIVRNT